MSPPVAQGTRGRALAALAAFVGILPVMPVALGVPAQVVMPLAMLLGGVCAGLTASWRANRHATDGSRSRLVPVTGVAVAVAVPAGGLTVLGMALTVPLPPIAYAVVCAVLIGSGAAEAAHRLRTSTSDHRGDLARSLLLALLGLAAVIGGLPVLCATTLSCHA